MFYPNPEFYNYEYRRPYRYDYWNPYFNPYSYAAANIINSQIAANNQSIYNAGVMAGVTQVANAINFNRRW